MTGPVTLKSIDLFSQLSDEAFASIEAVLKARALLAGEVIFNQGDKGDELIIVKEGRVAIYVPVAGSPQTGQAIRIFQPGEVLGEMALIDHKPRSLSARAEGKTTILILSGEDFWRVLRQNVEMPNAVMAGLSERIRYTTDFLSEVRLWVQKVADGSYQASSFQLKLSGKREDKMLTILAAEFAEMAARVQAREEKLRQEVAQLRIEIDEKKRKQDVQDIMSSDYYQKLKAKVKDIREQGEQDE